MNELEEYLESRPEEQERRALERDPEWHYHQRCRADRLCSKPVTLDHPERDFPILAVDPDDIGPVLAMRSEREELPF